MSFDQNKFVLTEENGMHTARHVSVHIGFLRQANEDVRVYIPNNVVSSEILIPDHKMSQLSSKSKIPEGKKLNANQLLPNSF